MWHLGTTTKECHLLRDVTRRTSWFRHHCGQTQTLQRCDFNFPNFQELMFTPKAGECRIIEIHFSWAIISICPLDCSVNCSSTGYEWLRDLHHYWVSPFLRAISWQRCTYCAIAEGLLLFITQVWNTWPNGFLCYQSKCMLELVSPLFFFPDKKKDGRNNASNFSLVGKVVGPQVMGVKYCNTWII